jgi:protein SCO1
MMIFALLFAAPSPLTEVRIDERLGAEIPADLELTDHRGVSIRFDDLRTDRPTVLVLGYYRCPMLCSLVQNGVARTVGQLSLRPGRDFELLTVSFDPDETSADASKRHALIGELEWRFFVSDASSIARLLDTAGVRVAKDPQTGQWAHAAVFLVLTPDHRIARYFYGFEVPARELEHALVLAKRGDVQPSLVQLLLRCFSYDPATRRHGPAIATAFRIGGGVLLFLVFAPIAVLFARERRRRTP